MMNPLTLMVHTMTNNKSNKFTIHGILPVDKPTVNGRIYPREVVEKALIEYRNKFISQGKAFGEVRGKHADAYISFNSVSHKITDIGLDDDGIYCTIKILDTPCGIKAQKLAMPLNMDIRGIGSVHNGMICNFELISIDIVKPDEEDKPPRETLQAIKRLWLYNRIEMERVSKPIWDELDRLIRADERSITASHTPITNGIPEFAGLACTDGGCIFDPMVGGKQRGGQHTNGGCRCLSDLPFPTRRAITKLIYRLRSTPSQEPQP